MKPTRELFCFLRVFPSLTVENCPDQSKINSKREGHEYRMLMSSLYNHDAHQLLPGGVAILFGWGSTSNILKKGEKDTSIEPIDVLRRSWLFLTERLWLSLCVCLCSCWLSCLLYNGRGRSMCVVYLWSSHSRLGINRYGYQSCSWSDEQGK